MSSPLLVSIVIVNHNYARFLAEAIDSALGQTYAHVEVIVVDDGSTDDSLEVTGRYGDRVRVVCLDANVGQAAGYQAGFEVSRGALINFLDSDDRLGPTAVERVVAAWRPGVAKVHFRVREMDAAGQLLPGMVPASGLPLDAGDLADQVLRRGYYYTPPSGGNFYAREAVATALPRMRGHHRVGADYALYMIAALCGEVVAIEAPLGYYRLHGGNNSLISRRQPERMAMRVRNGLASESALVEVATERRLRLPRRFRISAHCNARLALRVLHPAHYPVPDVGVLPLALEAAAAAFLLDVSPARRTRAALALAAVGVLPAPLARRLITWVQFPEDRGRGGRA